MSMRSTRKLIALATGAALLALASPSSAAQPGGTDSQLDHLRQMSLEELLAVEFTSASKFPEAVVDTPMAASVITSNQIRDSGATSIPEALRLVPGVLVLEQSPGVHSVFIRGLGNLPPKQFVGNANNSSTLVMIDGRVVYNPFTGGTHWDSLPIGLHDIDRIEVIRGPASALYGPNALTGVISIITRKPEEEGLHARASLEGGTGRSLLARAAVDYKLDDDYNVSLSGYYNQRGRYQRKYWSYVTEELETAKTIQQASSFGPPRPPNPDRFMVINPHPKFSMERKGINLALRGAPTESIELDFSGGYQQSDAAKADIGQGWTPPTRIQDRAGHVNLRASGYGVSGRFSWLRGKHSEFYGKNEIFDVELEYGYLHSFDFGQLRIRPGASYSHAVLDPAAAVIPEGSQRRIGSVFLRTEQRIKALRLVGAIRWDEYNHPDDGSLTGNFAATYDLSPNHTVRINYGHAVRSPFINETHLDFGDGLFVGNKDLDLVEIDSVEGGYRGKLLDNLAVDIEAWGSFTKNYSAIFQINPTLFRRENTDVKTRQFGLTTSLTWEPTHGLVFQTFGTYQRTRLLNLDDELQSAKYDSSSVTDRYTPAFFGGFWLNYRPIPALSLHLSGNFWTKTTVVNNRGDFKLPARAVFNFNAGYDFTSSLTGFITVRSLATRSDREYIGSDIIDPTILFGVRIRK
jgi:iron complex outermembrane receptor protein